MRIRRLGLLDCVQRCSQEGQGPGTAATPLRHLFPPATARTTVISSRCSFFSCSSPLPNALGQSTEDYHYQVHRAPLLGNRPTRPSIVPPCIERGLFWYQCHYGSRSCSVEADLSQPCCPPLSQGPFSVALLSIHLRHTLSLCTEAL